MSGYNSSSNNGRHPEKNFNFQNIITDCELEAHQGEEIESGIQPSAVIFSDREAASLLGKLTDEGTFSEGVSILLSWLEKGECNKKNAGFFFNMINIVNSHVRVLMNKKEKMIKEAHETKKNIDGHMQNTLFQLNDIVKVMSLASSKIASDNFSVPELQKGELWKTNAEGLKTAPIENTNVNLAKSDYNKAQITGINWRKQYEEKIQKLREEKDNLQCQLAATQCEAKFMKFDGICKLRMMDSEIRALQLALANRMWNMQRFPPREEAGGESQACRSRNMLNRAGNECLEMNNITVAECDSTSVTANYSPAIANRLSVYNEEVTARLIGLISIYLLPHPFGVNIHCIRAYLEQVDSTFDLREIELLMKRFPNVFQERVVGIGANMERKWFNVAFG